MIRFRSLRVKMIVFLVALLGAVQITEFALTNDAKRGWRIGLGLRISRSRRDG